LGAAAATLAINGGTLDIRINSTINAHPTTVGGAAAIITNRSTTGAGVAHTLGTLSIGAFNLSISGGSSVTSGTAGLNFGATTFTGAPTFTINNPVAAGTITQFRLAAVTNGANLATINGDGNMIQTGIWGNGTGGITMGGTGILTLDQGNTFTGTLRINSGIVIGKTSAAALGAGSLTLAGGTLHLQNATGLTFDRNTTVLSSSTIISNVSALGLGVTHRLGTLSIGSQTLTISGGTNVNSGTAGLIFGNPTFTAATTPVFTINNPAAGGVTQLSVAAVTNNASTATINGNGNMVQTAAWGATAGGITMNGTGTLTLNQTNTFTGVLAVNSGTVVGTSLAGALGAGTLTLGGGILYLTNALATPLTFDRNTTVSASSTIISDVTSAGAGVTHRLGTLSMGNQTLTVTAGTNVTSGTGGIDFNGAVTFTNSTTPTFDIGTSALLNLTGTATNNTVDVVKDGAGELSFVAANKTIKSLAINAGTLTSTSTTLSLAGNFTSNGTFAHNNGLVSFNGGVAQTIGGSVPPSFYSLTINNSSGGVSLSTPVVVGVAGVGGVFTLTNGILTTDPANVNSLTVANTATNSVVGGSATSYVNGPMNITLLAPISVDGTNYYFPVGNSTGGYRPFELINIRTITAPPVMRMTLAESGPTTFDGTITAFASTRNWRLQTIGTANFTSSAIRINETGLVAQSVIGRATTAQTGSYTSIGGNSIGVPANTITSNAGTASNAWFVIANQPCAGLWTGFTSAVWEVGNNWCDGNVPITSTNVVIPGAVSSGRYPVISATAAVCNNLTVNTNGVIVSLTHSGVGAINLSVGGNFTNNGITTVTTTGVINLTGNFSNTGTFTAGTGTVDFNSNSTAQTVNRGASTFYNLTHSGSADLTQVTTALNVTNIVNNSGGGVISLANLGTTFFGDLRGNGILRKTSTTARTVQVGSANLNSTFAGTIEETSTGLLTVQKVGTGIWTLTGTNTYDGLTTISAGILNIQNGSALGGVTPSTGGTSVTAGATLQLQGGISIGTEELTLNGIGSGSIGALNNISDNNTWGGKITLGSASTIQSDAGTLTINNANSVTSANFGLTIQGAGNGEISGIIASGSGTLTKGGAGTWTLSGGNTYSGATSLNAG
jgi:autotransporter-associated beta strand protein